MQTDVSVVVPAYNRGYCLRRALDSVINQTRAAREIILVDDGSEDDTGCILQTEYPEVHYIRQENRGVSAARNRGIRAASSTWIALLDSDDEWLPDKLAKQLEILHESGTRLCHTEEIWIRNGKRVNAMHKHRKQGGWIYQRCLPRCVISPSAALLHRELFNEYGLFDERLPACEDYDMWLRVCSQEAVSFIETPLIVKYGGHTDQLSRAYWGMDRFRVQALENIVQQGQLAEQNLALTLEILLEKIAILRQGAAKRGNQPLLDELTLKQNRYARMQLELAS
jgi:glycosyltransferase involved in cell wall biosynthesis